MTVHTGSETMGNGMRFYDIAHTLQKKREELGWPMRKVAAMIGVNQSSISMWERGRQAPSLVNVLRWCDVLGFEIHLVENDGDLA